MVNLFAFVLCLDLAAGLTITNLTMSDYPTNERGYIIATTSEGIVSPVCGRVNLNTAWTTCLSVGWLGFTGAGNTGELGIQGPNNVTEPILLSGLSCTDFRATGTGKEFHCTVSITASGCTSDNVAAVTCYFSVGQVAGIAAGLVALCLLCVILPIICCCACCCCGVGCAARRKYHSPPQEYV